jgi:glycosyltransferase involved in cell wall biosynthesis
MLGWQSDESIRAHYRRCRALLFPGVEDFGIVPLEAQACGTPVIAYADGGATETVIPPCGATPGTGLFFNEQSVEAMKGAICAFEANPACVDASKARAHAEQFATGRFARDLIDYCLGLAAADRLDELPPQRVAA